MSHIDEYSSLEKIIKIDSHRGKYFMVKNITTMDSQIDVYSSGDSHRGKYSTLFFL